MMCANIAPNNPVTYVELLVNELLTDEFCIIVKNDDYICKRCASLTTHMVKLDGDLKVVKNKFVSLVHGTYGHYKPNN